MAWLLRELRRSRATWKVIASDMPIGLVVPDGTAAQEGIAQGRPQALGRELQVARMLSGIKAAGVRNVVWLTADVHYAAAHHHDPARAVFGDFDPFWEFVAGPLHAGTFGTNALDPTFGPEVRFRRAADRPNQPPSDGLQFFGHVVVDGRTETMTVRLLDAEPLDRVPRAGPRPPHDDSTSGRSGPGGPVRFSARRRHLPWSPAGAGACP